MWPAGTAAIATHLDRLAVPLDAGRPTAREALRQAELTAENKILSAALRYRRSEADKALTWQPQQ